MKTIDATKIKSQREANQPAHQPIQNCMTCVHQ
jgi:hypothetical protein